MADQICMRTAFSLLPTNFANTQVLFDPAKKQFDLPAFTVEFSDLNSRQGKLVGEENERA